MRKETDQLHFEGCVPNPDSLLANQVRMFFGHLPKDPRVVYHNGLASELGTFGDVQGELYRRLQDAIFEEGWARTNATDPWSGGGQPDTLAEWRRAKAEVEEIRALIAATKIGVYRRLSEGG